MPITIVSMPLQVATGQANACAVVPDPVAPEFLVSVNSCKPKETVQARMALEAKTIEAILEHVVGRLNGPLDPIWDGVDGHHPTWQARTTCTPEENARIQADEEWARWCTELMVGTGYGGVSEYGAGFDDERFFRAFEDAPWNREHSKSTKPISAEEVNRPANPVVPVKMACQQLCTYAYYSRGFLFDEVMSQEHKKGERRMFGVTASSNGHLGHLFDGGWDPDRRYADLSEAFGRSAGGVTPGSILGFLPKGAKTQTPGSHVAFVLRVASSISKAQFFDTGAVTEAAGGLSRSKEGNNPKAVASFNGTNYDDRLFGGHVGVSGVRGVTVRCEGFGSLRAKDPAVIRAAIANARKARPLGLARLAILRRSWSREKNDRVVYISPRVWMHDTASDVNYYISRFIWSLRETPGHGDFEVLWQIAHPRSDKGKTKSDLFADECRNATRDVPLATVWGSKVDRPRTGFLAMSNAEKGSVHLRQRVKLQPKASGGQRLVAEGGSAYDDIIEYDYTKTQADDSEKYVHVRGVFSKIDPGKHWLTEALRDKPFAPPAFFAPW